VFCLACLRLASAWPRPHNSPPVQALKGPKTDKRHKSGNIYTKATFGKSVIKNSAVMTRVNKSIAASRTRASSTGNALRQIKLSWPKARGLDAMRRCRPSQDPVRSKGSRKRASEGQRDSGFLRRGWGVCVGVGMPSRDFTSEDLFSSRIMSMHSSTHSSQMNTVGPAISLRTSCW
jgi:hypothetical protein